MASALAYWNHRRVEQAQTRLDQVQDALAQPLLVELRPLRNAPVDTPHATLGLASLPALMLLQMDTQGVAHPGDPVTVELLQRGRSLQRSEQLTTPSGQALLAAFPQDLETGELEVVVVGSLDGVSYLIDLR